MWNWIVGLLIQEAPIWLFYSFGTGIAATLGQIWWRRCRDRPYRDWNLEIRRPDGEPIEAMKLSVEEVRSFEQSEFERFKWIKSAVSNFGQLLAVTLPEIEKAGWCHRDADRRTYVINLQDAIERGHVRPHLGPGDTTGASDPDPEQM